MTLLSIFYLISVYSHTIRPFWKNGIIVSNTVILFIIYWKDEIHYGRISVPHYCPSISNLKSFSNFMLTAFAFLLIFCKFLILGHPQTGLFYCCLVSSVKE